MAYEERAAQMRSAMSYFAVEPTGNTIAMVAAIVAYLTDQWAAMPRDVEPLEKLTGVSFRD